MIRSARVRELYTPRGFEFGVSKAREHNRIEKGPLDSSFSIPHHYNSCCSRRAAALSCGQYSAAGGSAGEYHNMHTHTADPCIEIRLFTSFTLPFFSEVNSQIALRHLFVSPSFTSFTPFSKGRIMWAQACERASARINLSPLRMTGERSEQPNPIQKQSGDSIVHSARSSKVNGGVAL